MSETITVRGTVAVTNGPTIPLNLTLTVDAYDKFDVTVPAGSADLPVDLQPGAAGKVQFLLVIADWFGTTLSYKVNAAGGAAFTLDQPHLLTGTGAAAMLDPAAPTTLLFSNSTAGATAKDAKVQILVGRKATP